VERLTLDVLPRYEKALLAVYLKRLRYRDEVELYAFSLAAQEEASRATILAARLHLVCEDGSSLWCMATLGDQGHGPREHEHQFVSIFDTAALDAVEWVCSAYHYDRYVERVGHGHTFPLASAGRMRRYGYSAALVLGGDFYQHFATDLGKVSGIATTLFAVLPLTESESTLKRDRGLQALLASWEEAGHDALRFRAECVH
jgi:hypothetical protein